MAGFFSRRVTSPSASKSDAKLHTVKGNKKGVDGDDEGGSHGSASESGHDVESSHAHTSAQVVEEDFVADESEGGLASHDVFAASGTGDVDFKGLTWPHASVLVAKLQMGIGIIGIPGTFATLGMVPGLVSLLILSVAGTYTGILCGQIRLLHPEIHSPAELGLVLFGNSRICVEVFGFLYWLFLVLCAGSGFLTSTVALNAVSEHAICTLGWLGVVAAISLLVGGGFRQLAKVAWLGWIGVMSVFLAIWILVIAMLTKTYPLQEVGQVGAVERVAVNTSTTFFQAMSAVVTQLFAIMGSIMFYSVSAEMRRPQDFSRAVLCGNGFVIFNYICVGVIVYAKAGQFLTSPALGSAGPLFKKICYGISLPGVIFSSIMFTHLAAKFVFVRALRGTRHLTTSTATHWSVWTSSYAVVVAVSFILAAAIPVFDQLLAIIGATTGSFFVFIVGGCVSLYILAHRKRQQQREGAIGEDDHSTREHASTSANPNDAKRQRLASVTRHRQGWFLRAYDVAREGDVWARVHYASALGLLIIGLFLLVAATWGSIKDIVDAYAAGDVAEAFSCADNSNSS